MSSCPAGRGGGGDVASPCREHLHTCEKRCSAKVFAAKPCAPRLCTRSHVEHRKNGKGGIWRWQRGRRLPLPRASCYGMGIGNEGRGRKQELCHVIPQRGQQKFLGATLGADVFMIVKKIMNIQSLTLLLWIPPPPPYLLRQPLSDHAGRQGCLFSWHRAACRGLRRARQGVSHGESRPVS